MYQGEICDVHVHVYHAGEGPEAVRKLHAGGVSRYVLLGTGSYDVSTRGISNLEALYQKLREPGLCYAFASIDHPDTGTATAESMLEQVRMYHAMGFDGIKMIEGKPKTRLRTGKPLDDPVYEPMLGYLEENDIPVLSHVNDPRYFWDKSKMNAFQIAAGWYAGPECESFETVRAEALHTMQRHPKLRTVFAHFFFAAGSIAEAEYIFDRYPNVSFDLTPGTHYMEMADERGAWRELLIRRADRLLYGTDSSIRAADGFQRACQAILETDDVIPYQGKQLRCFALPDDTLDTLYHGSFDRFCGASPRPVNTAALPEFLEWSRALVADSAAAEQIRREMDALRI